MNVAEQQCGSASDHVTPRADFPAADYWEPQHRPTAALLQGQTPDTARRVSGVVSTGSHWRGNTELKDNMANVKIVLWKH